MIIVMELEEWIETKIVYLKRLQKEMSNCKYRDADIEILEHVLRDWVNGENPDES
jgi:hypothetical protein